MNKKKIVITCVAGVAIFIAGYFVGDASAVSSINKQISKSTSTNSVSTSTETKQSTEDKKVIKAGEEGDSGSWNMKILEAKEATIIEAGNSSDNKATTQKFIVVKLQIKNITQSPVQYSANEFKLGDMKTKNQYNTAFEAMGEANSKEMIYNKNGDFTGVYNDVNPNMPKQTYIIFEVPKDMNISDAVLINQNKGSKEAQGFYIK